jgi:hypothetical protein
MALTIVPAVSGTTKKWGIDVAAFWAGSFLGALVAAMAMIAIFGALAIAVSRPVLATAVAVIGGGAIMRDFGIPVPLPFANRQVPERWRRQLPITVASFAYGLVLGAVFPTLFTGSTQLTFLLVIPFLSSSTLIVGVVALFALGKTSVLLLGLGTQSEAEVLARIQNSEAPSSARRLARSVANAGVSSVVIVVLLYATGAL